MKLRDFAEIVNGILSGDPECEIKGVAGIADAVEGDITYLSSPKFLKELHASRASCVIVKDLVTGLTIPQITVSNPQYAFAKAIEYFYPETVFKSGISDKAEVSEKASIAATASVASFAVIDDDVSVGGGTVVMPGVFIGKGSVIGSNCFIHPKVVIREKVRIGDRVIIHAGTVIGSDGYGYVFEGGRHYKIPQVGGVIIGDDVEIGSNVSIDRATLGNTVIGKGTKIDNLVQIAHNVKIGEHSLIISQVGIAGSSELGSYVTLAGQVGIADHATIESGTMVAAQSGLHGHVEKGVYSGSPALPHKTWLKAQVLFGKLPDLNRKIKELEDRLNKLEKGGNRE